MITVLSLLLFGVALLISCATGNLYCLSAAALALLCYVFLVVGDARSLARRLERLLGASPGQASLALRTAWGVKLGSKLEALQYRLHSLTGRLESEAFLRKLGDEAGIDEAVQAGTIKGCEAGEDEEDALVFQMTLEYFLAKFSCQAGAILLLEEGSNGNVSRPRGVSISKIYSRGAVASGTRFEAQLRRHLWPYVQQGRRELLRVHDLECQVQDGDFGVFGLRYALLHEFSWLQEGERQKGLLWLGYGSGNPPRVDEYQLTAEVLRKVERELPSQLKLSKLSGEIAKVENVNRQKNDYIAHMSHDIRSPLNNIRAILNLFKLEGFSGDTPELISVAISNCENMSEIVEDILDYSKFSAGKLSAQKESLDLRACAAAVAESFIVSARLKGLELRVDLPSQPCQVFADRRQIKRVLSNIISNAIKYTSEGAVELQLEHGAKGMWCLRVRDSGVGMTAEQVSMLFSPFTRFHGPEIEGIGLGLALTKILVELNAGQIQVLSVPGQGSDFVLSLPQAPMERAKVEVERKVRGRGRAQSVLVVDDDPDCVTTLGRALSAVGCRVLQAHNVSSALEVLRGGEVDYLITDASMPDGGGRRLLSAIRAKGCRTVAVVLSGRDDPAEREDLKRLGARRVFCKPVEIEDLCAFLGCFGEEREARTVSAN
ncbi:MAG: response regulator [Deltaproteobacteria bacterium]|nr:response regulator [Deltaproteobacteria bacterium]